MSVLQRVVKPTTRRGKRFLLNREPQVVEGPKRALFLQGRNSSETGRRLLKDFYQFKKPDGIMLNKKNDIVVFENAVPLEMLCRKADAGIFMMISHNKKRPDNLIMGRIYNFSVLDMVEMKVDLYKGLSEFLGEKITLGVKPCLVFNGPHWEEKPELKHLKSMLIDFFHREDADCVRLQGLEHSISFTATDDGRVMLRSYRVVLKKSQGKTPRVEVEEIGPRVNFVLRRNKLPTEDLMAEACRQPKELEPKKKKNISTDALGTKHGQIHLGKQHIDNLQTRKMKALKKTPEERKALKRSAMQVFSAQQIPT